jgi:hypothetical protein
MYTITECAPCRIQKDEDDDAFFDKWKQEFDEITINVFNRNCELSDEQIKIIEQNNINKVYRPNVNWVITECHSDISLSATDYGSIFNEPCFGFKYIDACDFNQYQKFIDYHEQYYK